MRKLAARVLPKSRIARNSIFLVSAQLIGQGINTVVSILMRRLLLPERMGVIGTITSYGVLPGIIAEAGLTRVTIQQAARGEPEALPEIVGHMAATRFATNLLYLLITWSSLLLPFNAKLASQEKWFIMIWSISMVLQSLRRNGEAVFQATEKLRYHSMLVVANRLLAAVLVLSVIWLNRHTLGIPAGQPGWYTVIGMIFGAYLVVDALDALAAWIIVRRQVGKIRWSLDWRAKLTLLALGWPFALQMLAGQIYLHIDVPLIRYMFPRPVEEVRAEIGYYTTAYNMVLVLTQIPINLTYALFPQMSRAFHHGDLTRLFSLFRFNFQLMLLAGTLVALPFYLFRREFIVNIYGQSFWPSAHMMGILMWTLPFGFLNTALGNLLASSDRQHSVNVATIVAAAFNVIINVAMIPRCGAVGSSLATLATEVICCATLFFAVALYHRGSMQLRKLLPLLGFQVAMVCLFIAVDRLTAAGARWPESASFRAAVLNVSGWAEVLSAHWGTFLRLTCYLVYAAICVLWGRALARARRAGEQQDSETAQAG